MKKFVLLSAFFVFIKLMSCHPVENYQAKENKKCDSIPTKKITVAAERIDEYLPKLKNKGVGLVVNHTAIVENKHLVDTLLALGVDVKKIFAPEHGFRGKADAGEHINDSIDAKTKLPIISLYGNNKKPNSEMLSGIDIMIFDIQDVGVRFYTYISTMHYIMESCAEHNKTLLILDRPNPNGDYIDGPVLNPEFSSFVGKHQIPVVHGLTVGELALMINGEGWLSGGDTCQLEIVKVKNYTHDSLYNLPVKPSPNLPNYTAIRLYPSLCFFEATVLSIGRGTEFPFQVIGYPDPELGDFSFTPHSTEGAKNPKLKGQTCYGKDLRNVAIRDTKFTLNYLIEFYQKAKFKDKFFERSRFMSLLAGTDQLEKQIKQGMTETEIRNTWQEDLNQYKTMRKKYLLYE